MRVWRPGPGQLAPGVATPYQVGGDGFARVIRDSSVLVYRLPHPLPNSLPAARPTIRDMDGDLLVFAWPHGRHFTTRAMCALLVF